MPVRVGDGAVQVFGGNLTASDHFHELLLEQSSLLLGARLPALIARLLLPAHLLLVQTSLSLFIATSTSN